MRLRPLRKRDIPAALKLIKENYPHHPLFLRRARHELEAMFRPGVVVPQYIGAFETSTLVGFAGISHSWMDYDVYTLFWVNVEPSWQGQGVGTKMIRLLMRQAKQHQAKFLLFTTTRPGFYRRLGFRQLAKLHHGYVLMIGSLSKKNR